MGKRGEGRVNRRLDWERGGSERKMAKANREAGRERWLKGPRGQGEERCCGRGTGENDGEGKDGYMGWIAGEDEEYRYN